jgi:hypothetical protein
VAEALQIQELPNSTARVWVLDAYNT